MKKITPKIYPILIMSLIAMIGCSQTKLMSENMAEKPSIASAKKIKKKILKGKIVGKSNKAKTISILVGKGDKAKTMMVKFNDSTKGLSNAVKGSAAIIQFKSIGRDKIATVIQQKLAKLPEGVSEIQPITLAKMMENNEKFVLIDSRPAKVFHGGSIPGSISIPVPVMKKNGSSLLPADKNIQLVFYCGGVT